MTKFVFLVLRVFIVYSTLIIVMYSQNWFIGSAANLYNPVCKSKECQDLGAMYKGNMDNNSKPCVDFYNYVCNGWLRQHPKPRYTDVWNTVTLQNERTLAATRRLLEDKTVSNIIEFEEAKELYRACMSPPYMGNVDRETIMDVMIKVDVWPLIFERNKQQQNYLSPSLIDIGYMKATGESAFFDYTILPGDVNPLHFMTYLAQPASPYGMLERFKKWQHQELQHYKAFLSKIIQKIAPKNAKIDGNVLSSDLDKVIKFRDELRKIIETSTVEEPTEMYINSFQMWYDKLTNLQTTANIDWSQVIATIYQNLNSSSRGINVASSSIVFANTRYFTALANLLTNTPIRVIVNHIHLYFVERHLRLDSSMTINLKESVTDGLDGSGYVRYEQERWKTCLAKHSMGITLAKMYIKAFFPIEKKAAVEKLLKEAKKLQTLQVLESNWLDSTTKLMAMQKIAEVQSSIGYPDWTKILDEDIHAINPLKVQAIYTYHENHVRVSAAFLQYPFYTPNVPYVIDYAVTISLLGHELYHGFDNKGVLYDENGRHLPWPSEKYDLFYNQTYCFQDHFKKYNEKEFKKLDVNIKIFESSSSGVTFQVQRSDTILEDIADAMGLKLAHKGYRQKLKQSNGVCATLPGFENIGCEKLFFIAFANSYCEGSSIYTQERYLLTNEHSAVRVRVNAAVANMKEFSIAFNCDLKDPLAARQTCDLWQT